MKNKSNYKTVNYTLSEITKEEATKINGGDDVTAAVFFSIGYWVQAYADFKASGARSHGGSAGFM